MRLLIGITDLESYCECLLFFIIVDFLYYVGYFGCYFYIITMDILLF